MSLIKIKMAPKTPCVQTDKISWITMLDYYTQYVTYMVVTCTTCLSEPQIENNDKILRRIWKLKYFNVSNYDVFSEASHIVPRIFALEATCPLALKV